MQKTIDVIARFLREERKLDLPKFTFLFESSLQDERASPDEVILALIQLAISLEVLEGKREIRDHLENFFFPEEKEFVSEFYQIISQETQTIIKALHEEKPMVEKLVLRIEEQDKKIGILEDEVN